MLEILILNGPNLGKLGERQPEIYGSRGMDELPAMAARHIPGFVDLVHLQFFQANGQGQLIDHLQSAREAGINGIVVNAGAYTHTSLALADCLAWINIPYVEVHLSNILARSASRHKSLIADNALGMVAGFGLMSYVLALQAILVHTKITLTEE
ncbi:MAG: type II 3-dehydroquinate dehydratase [Thermodesulfobacteriota bacterium]